MFAGVLSSYKVLVYNGQFDLRVAVYGTNEYLRNLQWDGIARFNYQRFTPYTYNNTIKGLYKSSRNLYQLVVYGAGHLSPRDQGVVLLDVVNRFSKNISLLENCKKEPCQQQECPNQCSHHPLNGGCQSDFTCKCDAHYFKEDCSLYQNNANFGTDQRFSGYIFGKSFHIYNFDFDINKYSAGLFDFKLTLTKTSKFGKIHLLMNGGSNYTIPQTHTISSLVQQFQYKVLEDDAVKYIELNELSRQANSKVTVIVLNTVDTETVYNLVVTSLVSGTLQDGKILGLTFTLLFFGVIACILFVIVILQYFYAKKYDQVKNYIVKSFK